VLSISPGEGVTDLGSRYFREFVDVNTQTASVARLTSRSDENSTASTGRLVRRSRPIDDRFSE